MTQFTDLTASLERLSNLQYIYFTKESIEHIISFIRWLPNLREIEIYNIIGNEEYYNFLIYRVGSTDTQRRGKLKFYVHGKAYVATKKMYKRKTFKLLEFSRFDSHEDTNDFGWH